MGVLRSLSLALGRVLRLRHPAQAAAAVDIDGEPAQPVGAGDLAGIRSGDAVAELDEDDACQRGRCLRDGSAPAMPARIDERPTMVSVGTPVPSMPSRPCSPEP